MKSIKDAEWEVSFYQMDDDPHGEWFFLLETQDDIGLNCNDEKRGHYKTTRKQAEKEFKQFAKLNGITKYKFVN